MDEIMDEIMEKTLPTTTKKTISIPLPWSGEFNTQHCLAIQENHGLFTQCNKKKANTTYETKDNWYCTRCTNNLKKDGLTKPKLGNVVDRLRYPIMEYKDANEMNVKCIHYGNLLKKRKISIEDAKEACRKEGIIVGDELFEPS